jgi:hypothetical protein
MTRKLRIAIILDDIDTNEGGSFVSGKRFAA